IQDDRLVRGLDYYTNTAFEVHVPRLGANSAVGGGGRYNGLVKECGGPDIPGVGFALGLERILLALGEEAELPSPLDAFIVCFDPAYQPQAAELLNGLRQAGIRAERDYQVRSGKAQMKQAGKLGVRQVILLGADEAEQGFYTLRDMADGVQRRVEAKEIIAAVKAAI
ncbi:MAG: His/Gly/Thr/Pro-type tRNA ligase C-terminal domain-containing protein, partial [Syntrophomonadaceae bacterium]|nr:His/Gly/Thr/Pro-type tRNA ligase C-terminal domain-containing protein [Syntrophomonadaceae bacterium]